MDVMVDGKPLTAADVLRLGRQLEAAMELDEVEAIQAKAESWAAAVRELRTLTHNELVDVAHRAGQVLAGKPREAGTFAPAAWPEDGPPVLTPSLVGLLAKQAGVPAEAALATMRPSLLLWPRPIDAFELPAGTTRLGGAPDVPPGWEWPRRGGFPLAFLAQLRLADLAPGRPGVAGTLLFFGDVDASEVDHSSERWRVEHVPDGTPLAPAAFPPDLYRVCRYAPVAVELVPDLTAPEDLDAVAPALRDFLVELEGGREDATQHRVFGFPQSWQDPVLGDDAMLLLQLDTDWRLASPPNDGFHWGSGGRLHFQLPQADWDAGRFDRVRAEMTYT